MVPFTTQSLDADIAANEANTTYCKVNAAMAVGEDVRKIEEVDGKSQRRFSKRCVRRASRCKTLSNRPVYTWGTWR